MNIEYVNGYVLSRAEYFAEQWDDTEHISYLDTKELSPTAKASHTV